MSPLAGLFVAGFLADHLGWALVTLGILALGAVLAAIAISSRIRRRLRREAASLIFMNWADRREDRLGVPAALAQAAAAGDLIQRLPELVREVAGVEPVTAFVLDRVRHCYTPVASTLSPVPSDTIREDDPLPNLLKRIHSVRLLHGSPHDMKNIAIRAVNGRALQSCRAVCAVPLMEGETLPGLLLCGGTRGHARVGLKSLACLERMSAHVTVALELARGGRQEADGAKARAGTTPPESPRRALSEGALDPDPGRSQRAGEA